MVDALVLGTSEETLAGSSPVPGTMNWQQAILIATVFMGVGSTIVLFIFLFLKIYRKVHAWAIVFLLLLFMIPAGLLIYILGEKNASLLQTSQVAPNTQSISQTPNFTGQQLFDAVNEYRKANNVSPLKLDSNLCNNLAQRYLDIKAGLDEGVAHKGMEAWAKKFVPDNYSISEDFAWGNTPEEVIHAWEGSPGHRLSILNKDYKVGCSYAAEGYGIIELAYIVPRKAVSTYTGDGTRTGQIIPYHDWCNNKNISVYENELITKKSSDGKIYTMTQGDWDCYETYLKSQ